MCKLFFFYFLNVAFGYVDVNHVQFSAGRRILSWAGVPMVGISD